MSIKPRYVVGVVALVVLYIVAAKLGLSLALTVEQITTVWPPSGLALAALLLYGYKFWPGIFIGAFIANLLTNEPAGVALGIATGNTLEALAGAFLLRSIRFNPAIARVRDAAALVILAAVASTMIAASVGTLSLASGNLIGWADLPSAWFTWWFGDMAGVLLFAPVILVWSKSHIQLNKRNRLEAIALVAGTVAVTSLVFLSGSSLLGNYAPLSYLVVPFMVWAAFRFKQHGVTTVSLIVSIVAVYGTTSGHGPFARAESAEQQFIILLLYIIFITMNGLFMAVAVSQREDYALKLANARDNILQELETKAEREKQLESSQESITKILDRMLDENPRAHRDL